MSGVAGGEYCDGLEGLKNDAEGCIPPACVVELGKVTEFLAIILREKHGF